MVPSILRNIPSRLNKIDGAVTQADIDNANAVRKRYELSEWQNPYMIDIIRGFRLADGASTYIEVGTRDKGNLAWVAPKLLPSATIIDVDIDKFAASEKRLRNELKNVEYHCVTGDSIAPETLAQVRKALKGKQADVIFCDSSHMFNHTMSEFELYYPLIREGGVLMFHDCFWEGNEHHKGKAQAMLAIDRFTPVYCVYMDQPVHRFVPRSEKTDVWGGLAIIPKPYTRDL